MGGADGRLGIDGTRRVFAGLINMTTALDIHADYEIAGPPLVVHTIPWALVSNKGAATGALGTTAFFKPADPAPVLLAQPLLDSGQTNAGTGGNTACMRSSNVVIDPVNPAVGQRWKIQCMDSPGGGFPRMHFSYPTTEIRRVFYDVSFRACFCFWTNVTGVEAAVDAAAANAVANRLYTVIRIDEWRASGAWSVSFPAAGPTLTATTPHKIRITSRRSITPMGRAEDNGVEVRPPTGIANMTLNAR